LREHDQARVPNVPAAALDARQPANRDAAGAPHVGQRPAFVGAGCAEGATELAYELAISGLASGARYGGIVRAPTDKLHSQQRMG
jgi:hypothetical protein